MVKKVDMCNCSGMVLFTLSSLLLVSSQAQAADTSDALEAPASKTLEQRCPSGFAPPDIYKYLSKEPVMTYPPRALRMNMEGAVGMRLIVGCDGVVKECGILSSSGHRLLDEHACQIMAKVAFDPPRDENGKAREASYTTSITFDS